MNAAAASNCFARARCVMSPLSITRSGPSSSTRADERFDGRGLFAAKMRIGDLKEDAHPGIASGIGRAQEQERVGQSAKMSGPPSHSTSPSVATLKRPLPKRERTCMCSRAKWTTCSASPEPAQECAHDEREHPEDVHRTQDHGDEAMAFRQSSCGNAGAFQLQSVVADEQRGRDDAHAAPLRFDRRFEACGEGGATSSAPRRSPPSGCDRALAWPVRALPEARGKGRCWR